jgi:alpha-beta hydrolase superfamily lysophospholipase
MGSKMQPVAFDGHFGWLHPACGGSDNDSRLGIVLCNSLGHEALWLHQTLRQLAERLAQHGLTVLRFDYVGTGDSLDTQGWVRPIDWPDETVQAVEYLRRIAGVDRVALAGLRFGALVAAQAAHRVGADALALIAPTVSGRQFVREMKVLQQTWLEKTGTHVRGDPPPDGAIDVLGHRFASAAVDAAAKLDLRRVEQAPASRILMMHVDPRDPSHELAGTYASLGAKVDSHPFAGYTAAMQPSWLATVPGTALDSIADWFAADHASHGTRSVGVSSPSSGVRLEPVGDDTLLTMPGVQERPVTLAQGRLFGVLCEPADRLADPAPIVVIANTAATHRVGDGRFNVELARGLARAGFASLRLDASGLGDSAAAAAIVDPGSLSFDALAADTSRAVDWAIERGHPRAAVFGICSGAYLGLRAAVDNPSIDGLMLVNLLGFLFPDGYTMHNAGEASAGSTRAHFRSMLRAQKWVQVLRSEVSLGPVMRTLWQYTLARAQSIAAAWTNDALGSATKGHRVRKRMRDLDARGVQVRLLFSPLDHGLDELQMHFGRDGRRLSKLRHARAAIVRNMDHEVLNPAARERVATLCEAFLAELFVGLSSPSRADVPLAESVDIVHAPFICGAHGADLGRGGPEPDGAFDSPSGAAVPRVR